ncbi:energy transducer TonB [Helicobacter cetorum]|uniref:energy transducer TonB n=1 Tax=Helicobacter cetorum TaxID=138563 RepID=UPI000CF19F54|nr:energy transducer TonB [Helicobacter cetorum]
MSKGMLVVLSGFLAFFLYAGLLYTLLLDTQNQEAQKILLDLGKKSEQTIDLDLQDFFENETNKHQAEQENSQNTTEQEESEESLEDMFSSFDNLREKTTSDAKEEVEDHNLERRLEKQQRLKKNLKNQEVLKGLQQNLSQITEKLQTIKHKTLDLQIPKQDGIDNKAYQEWYAQVYKILYKGWKDSFYKSASVGVVVVIAKNGKFDYTILSYSNFKDYNDSIVALLNHLKEQDFPPYPGGHMISIKVNFTTKEEQ